MLAEGRDSTGIAVTDGWHSETGRVFKPTSEYLRTNGRVLTRTDVTTEGHSLLESNYGGYLKKSYYTQDSLGSVIGTFNDKGRIEEKYTYDAFGRVTEGRFDNVNRLGYNGKMIDPFSGNYDYGFRDYSPVAMRFTTVDPIKDSSNWYAYVGNDPINFIDPFGLCAESHNPSTEIGYTGVVGAEMVALGAVTLGVGIYGLNPPIIIGGAILIIAGNELATTGGIESTQEYIQNVADAISDFATQ